MVKSPVAHQITVEGQFCNGVGTFVSISTYPSEAPVMVITLLEAEILHNMLDLPIEHFPFASLNQLPAIRLKDDVLKV